VPETGYIQWRTGTFHMLFVAERQVSHMLNDELVGFRHIQRCSSRFEAYWMPRHIQRRTLRFQMHSMV